MKYNDAQAICEFGKRVYQNRFVAANDGNLSVRLPDASVLATPTGVSKGYMDPDMLVRLSGDGAVLERGERGPSSEVKMHLALYRENPDIHAVVHTHAPCATFLAILHQPIQTPLLPESVVLLGNVPVVDYAPPGSDALAEAVAPYGREHNAVLLANHGVVTWGADLESAYYTMETVEYYAKILLYSRLFQGQAHTLDRGQVEELIRMRAAMGRSKGGYPVLDGETGRNV